jgi:hypothetical protein
LYEKRLRDNRAALKTGPEWLLAINQVSRNSDRSSPVFLALPDRR